MVASPYHTLCVTQSHPQLAIQHCGISHLPRKDGSPRAKDEEKHSTSAIRNVVDMASSPSNAKPHSHRGRASLQRSHSCQDLHRSNVHTCIPRRRRTRLLARRPIRGNRTRGCLPEVRTSQRGRCGRMVVRLAIRYPLHLDFLADRDRYLPCFRLSPTTRWARQAGGFFSTLLDHAALGC